ncbi:hypothetical protein C0Q70_09564 [Pomacea canaliculata]|uniref:PDZ domain-containing protein n=1 Tax=Pomacea canaliculata TaxID=400727 RepID=A0A2T7PA55_POMCA|nr:hypothetical protein C0Q70_09564 [Pomacea canaliculata]
MLRFRYVPDGNSQRSRSEERVRSSSSLSGGQQNVPHSPPRCAASTRPAPRVKANVIVSRRTSEKVRDVLHPQEFVRRRDSSSPVKSEQGQNPCILSCIVGGSPADLAGLKAGDYLYVVNGINVSRALHDDVVRMVGQSTGTLELQVAENYNSSDSSEDDYSPRTKTRYPNRVRLRQQTAGTKQLPGMASRPLPQRPTDMKASHGKQRNHVPIGAESSVPASLAYPLSSAGDEKSPADYNEQTNAHRHAHYESIKVGKSDGRYRSAKTHSKDAESSTTDTTGEGFAFTTIQNGPVVSTAKISSGISKRPLSRAQELQTKNINPPVSREGVIKYGHAVDDGQDLDHDENEQNIDESETEEEEEGIPPVEHGTRAVVGYIGSIELPGNATRPNQRLQLYAVLLDVSE